MKDTFEKINCDKIKLRDGSVLTITNPDFVFDFSGRYVYVAMRYANGVRVPDDALVFKNLMFPGEVIDIVDSAVDTLCDCVGVVSKTTEIPSYLSNFNYLDEGFWGLLARQRDCEPEELLDELTELKFNSTEYQFGFKIEGDKITFLTPLEVCKVFTEYHEKYYANSKALDFSQNVTQDDVDKVIRYAHEQLKCENVIHKKGDRIKGCDLQNVWFLMIHSTAQIKYVSELFLKNNVVDAVVQYKEDLSNEYYRELLKTIGNLFIYDIDPYDDELREMFEEHAKEYTVITTHSLGEDPCWKRINYINIDVEIDDKNVTILWEGY